MCGVPTLVCISNQIPSNRMCGVPPILLKHLDILLCVPTLVLTSDQVFQIGLVSPNWIQTSEQVGCQSRSTCIYECGTSSWACLLLWSHNLHFSKQVYSFSFCPDGMLCGLKNEMALHISEMKAMFLILRKYLSPSLKIETERKLISV